MKSQTITEDEYIRLVIDTLQRLPATNAQEIVKAVRVLRDLDEPVAQGLYSQLLRAYIADLDKIEQEMKDELARLKRIRSNDYHQDDDDGEEVELTDEDYRSMVDEHIAMYSNVPLELEKRAMQSLTSVQDILSEYQAGAKFSISAQGEALYSSADGDQYRVTRKKKSFEIDDLQQLPSAIRNWVYELGPTVEDEGQPLQLSTVTIKLSAKLKDYDPAHASLEVLDFGNAAQIAGLLNFNRAL